MLLRDGLGRQARGLRASVTSVLSALLMFASQGAFAAKTGELFVPKRDCPTRIAFRADSYDLTYGARFLATVGHLGTDRHYVNASRGLRDLRPVQLDLRLTRTEPRRCHYVTAKGSSHEGGAQLYRILPKGEPESRKPEVASDGFGITVAFRQRLGRERAPARLEAIVDLSEVAPDKLVRHAASGKSQTVYLLSRDGAVPLTEAGSWSLAVSPAKTQ